MKLMYKMYYLLVYSGISICLEIISFSVYCYETMAENFQSTWSLSLTFYIRLFSSPIRASCLS